MAPFRWMGSKQHLSRRMLPSIRPVVSHARVYVEPYAGSLAIYWRLPRFEVEVVSDLDADIVNFYRVLQDEALFRALYRRLRWTPYLLNAIPYANRVLQSSTDPVLRAWATMFLPNIGNGGTVPRTTRSGGRSFKHRGLPCQLAYHLIGLAAAHRRLQGARIYHSDALAVIEAYNGEDTLFYLDPPYLPLVRDQNTSYSSEVSVAYHEHLLEVLLGLKGYVFLSSYDNPLYRRVLGGAGWRSFEYRVVCGALHRRRGSKFQGGVLPEEAYRTDVMWCNPRAAAVQ